MDDMKHFFVKAHVLDIRGSSIGAWDWDCVSVVFFIFGAGIVCFDASRSDWHSNVKNDLFRKG